MGEHGRTGTMPDRIRDAVIVHGPGRSGTTLLGEILSLHSAFSWISGYVNRFPAHPVLAVFNRVMAIDAVERWSRSKRYWPRPAEAYGFWDYYFPYFSDPETRSKTKRQDRPAECIAAIRRVQRFHGRKRFITKITGLPRADELAAVFDDPHIVYIHRDPRAVVASYFKQRWGYKNKPDVFSRKTEIELLAEYVRRYVSSLEGRASLEAFPFHDVLYEQMVDVPELFFRNLLSTLGLSPERAFFERLTSWKMDRQSNEAWKKQFSKDGVAFLNESLADYVDFTASLQSQSGQPEYRR
jgi:hypothetical protein